MLRATGYRLFCLMVYSVGCLGSGAAAALIGGRAWTFWVPVCVIFARFVVRAWRLALLIEQDEIVIRGWLRTRRIPRGQIEDVLTSEFRGEWPAEVPLVDWWNQR